MSDGRPTTRASAPLPTSWRRAAWAATGRRALGFGPSWCATATTGSTFATTPDPQDAEPVPIRSDPGDPLARVVS